MRIDAHQHFWKMSRGDYGWLTPELGCLYDDFLPDDMTPLLESNQISGTVLVQAAPTEAETRYMLDLAKEHDFVKGVVGWVGMEEADVVPRLRELMNYGGGYLKGIRPMIQDISDPDWVLSPKLDTGFQALEKLGLCFDALIRPIHLENLHKRLNRHPNLKVVIDHGAKPDIVGGSRSKWATGLAALAKLPNVYCKLSGLITEAGPDWQSDDLRPFIGDILFLFGPERVMWGSDWPLLNLAADYGQWFEIVSDILSSYSSGDKANIFGETARRFYGL